jgi:hypothetical protein
MQANPMKTEGCVAGCCCKDNQALQG